MSEILLQLNREMAAIVEHVRPSLVQLRHGRRGLGAGTVWQADGLIVTNAHVVRQHAPQATLADGRTVSTQVVALDTAHDLAVLSVAAVGLTAATLADAQNVEPMPEPRRAGRGGTNPGPKNPARARQNPDLISPPATDHGTLPNLRFSFDDSHIRLESGGWTRQVTQRELGISKNIAGVNMRLNAGGVRELHWHKAAEWAYMLYGTLRITAVDNDGRNFVDDVGVGDLWYFPSGIPHSIQ